MAVFWQQWPLEKNCLSLVFSALNISMVSSLIVPSTSVSWGQPAVFRMYRLSTVAFHHSFVPEVRHESTLALGGTSVTCLCWGQQRVPAQLRPESDSPREAPEPACIFCLFFFFLSQVKFKSSRLHLTQWLSHVYVSSYFHRRNCFCFSPRACLVCLCASKSSKASLWDATRVCDRRVCQPLLPFTRLAFDFKHSEWKGKEMTAFRQT